MKQNNKEPENRKKRGTQINPKSRFDTYTFVLESDTSQKLTNLQAAYIVDTTKKIITSNESPDIPFDISVNPYRGCEHGCIYCYARPYHEFIGYSAGLEFETKILYKPDAPKLLTRELCKKNYIVKPIEFCGVTDAYQPIEQKMQITRQCLEICAAFNNPVAIITKSTLITRDIDILRTMAAKNLVTVIFSITSLDDDLTRLMEPRAATGNARLKALNKLSLQGIPVGISLSPVIPGLTDKEIPRIIQESVAHGAKFGSYSVARLPGAVKEIFSDWLQHNFPDRAQKVLHGIENFHGGNLSSSESGKRFSGKGIEAQAIKTLFSVAQRKYGLNKIFPSLRTDLFEVPRSNKQLNLFD
ncbi:MAG: PA0069 family radical SAM protein [Ignavibacteria bacterium]|nr:PA0069 family radical SAM protein [Ignavibacteria bacterium]